MKTPAERRVVFALILIILEVIATFYIDIKERQGLV
jgi:hypothetical protein